MAKKKRTEEKSVPPHTTEPPVDRHLSRNMVRLPPAVHRQLKRLAERNNRPLSWELRRIVIDALEQNGLWPAED